MTELMNAPQRGTLPEGVKQVVAYLADGQLWRDVEDAFRAHREAKRTALLDRLDAIAANGDIGSPEALELMKEIVKCD